ncbi:MAG: hypothetical protein Q9195_003111 [Heterodermia aff. obscurata]
MDPLTAVNLAGNIIQFVEFGSNLVCGSLDIYKSANGATSINSELELITEDLTGLCSKLVRPFNLVDEHLLPKIELDLLKLSRSCGTLGENFQQMLESLKVKGRNRKWDSVRQALKTQWKAKDIEQYQRRLANFRSEIACHLLTILSDQQNELQSTQIQILEKQSKISVSLGDIAASLRRLDISAVNGPLRLKDEIILFLQQFLAQSSNRDQARDLDIEHGSLRWHKLPSQLFALTRTIVSYAKELSIVESLRYDEITEREERILGAHPRTFDWLFNEAQLISREQPPVSLLHWLRSSSGTYWISGRAGSGKSTLMKYLYQHEKTLTALKTWAGAKKLVTARFYFWHAGTEMQKSQKGLLQTLLFHILKECPQMVASICPLRWEADTQFAVPWTQGELYKAFELLKEQDLVNTRFCFFLDGLDEYKGEHTDIIDTVNSFVFGSNIKVLFSSRPWVVFERAYGENNFNKLYLHEYTKDDIQRFVRDKFAEDDRFQELRGSDHRYEQFVEQIVKRAHGVFLWVFLVVRSLRMGLVNCDTLDELHARLHAIPTDLEEYFRNMFDSTEKMYHKQAARIFQMCLSDSAFSSGGSPSTTISFFDQTSPKFCLTEKIHVWTYEEIEQIQKKTRTRVMARCPDLLEVSVDCVSVFFLHRTVYDFLTTREVREILEERAGPGFDADLLLGNAVLCEIKHSPDPLQTQFDQYAHCPPLIQRFMYSIHKLELRSNRDYLPLVDELEKFITFLHDNPTPKYDSLLPKLAAVLPSDWVKVMAVKGGFFLYLSREKQLGLLDKETRFAGRPPLDIVLRPYANVLPYLPTPVLSLNVQLVNFFLEIGMDPNQRHENGTVWSLFLNLLCDASLHETGHSSHEIAEIFESLLAAGADPDFVHERALIWEAVSRHCEPEDAKHVEGVRLRMRP